MRLRGEGASGSGAKPFVVARASEGRWLPPATGWTTVRRAAVWGSIFWEIWCRAQAVLIEDVLQNDFSAEWWEGEVRKGSRLRVGRRDVEIANELQRRRGEVDVDPAGYTMIWTVSAFKTRRVRRRDEETDGQTMRSTTGRGLKPQVGRR